MGLDTYLSARQFTSKEHFNTDIYNRLVKEAPFSLDFATLEINVIHWKKSNHIHKWFVDNVQDGKDDCNEYEVSRKQLEELLSICKQVALNKDDASKLLPRREGFFFGSYEYDQQYFKDIEYTISQIEKILKEFPNDWTFRYHSSW